MNEDEIAGIILFLYGVWMERAGAPFPGLVTSLEEEFDHFNAPWCSSHAEVSHFSDHNRLLRG